MGVGVGVLYLRLGSGSETRSWAGCALTGEQRQTGCGGSPSPEQRQSATNSFHFLFTSDYMGGAGGFKEIYSSC